MKHVLSFLHHNGNKFTCTQNAPKIFELKSSGLSFNESILGGEDQQIICTNLFQNIASIKSLDVNVLAEEHVIIATLNYSQGKSHGLALFTSSGERWGKSLAALQLILRWTRRLRSVRQPSPLLGVLSSYEAPYQGLRGQGTAITSYKLRKHGTSM